MTTQRIAAEAIADLEVNGMSVSVVVAAYDADTARKAADIIEDHWMRANKAEAERDAAQRELQQIRTMLDDGTNGNASTALEMVKRLHSAYYELQRKAWYERT